MNNINEKPFQIGNIVMDNRVVLAPMAGICNSAFRLTVKEFGAGLVYAEMISDKAINFRNEKTMGMLYIDERENIICFARFAKRIRTAEWRRRSEQAMSQAIC